MGHEIKDMAVEIANKPSVLEVVEKAKDKAADVADLKREELDELLVLANKKAEQFKQMAAKYVREQKAELDAKYKKATAKKKKTTKKKAVAKKAKPVEKAAPVKKAPAKKAAPKKPVAKKTPVKKVVAKKKAAPKKKTTVKKTTKKTKK